MEAYSSADNEIMNEDVEQSVPCKRKRKALVWDNFEVTLINGEDKATCKHCGKILSAKASHGTNSLNTHVKSCKGLQSQSTRSQGTVKMGQFDKTHETNAKTELANMIIMHENTVKKEIMKIFEFEKEKTMNLIQMNTSRIAITTDMWTASNQKKGFMAITLHFINDSWNLQSRLLRESIQTIKSSVAYWTGGPKRKEIFVKMTRQMEVGCSRKLILDCKTRWNSTYLMLQIAVEYRTVFLALKTREYKDVPSEQDWNLVVEIAEKLQLFFKATELLSGTKYPTANLLFPKICQIKLAISKWLQSDISEVVEMTNKMEEKFEKYWGVIGTIVVATIIDPRIRSSDNDLGDDDIDVYDAFVSGSSKDTDKSDLERYLDETILPRVARDVLVILVSTVASESAFSTGGRIVSPHRNRLHSNTLEALVEIGCGVSYKMLLAH
ncbi:hypothetical protein ACLB2K_008781 [Fragaria x ananassa]